MGAGKSHNCPIMMMRMSEDRRGSGAGEMGGSNVRVGTHHQPESVGEGGRDLPSVYHQDGGALPPSDTLQASRGERGG